MQLMAHHLSTVLNLVFTARPLFTSCPSQLIKRNMAVSLSITPGERAVPHSTEI